MSEVNEILKKVTASIEEATGKFNAKAERARLGRMDVGTDKCGH